MNIVQDQLANRNQVLTEASFGWGERFALGFGPDWIRTLVSMATDSSHRLYYNGENLVNTLVPSFSSSYLQVTRSSITSRTSWKFGQIGPRTVGLAALERL